MGIADNDRDPAFRFESLAREAFGNCRKYGDPWNYAHQEFFSEFVKEPVSLRGQRALATILTQLVFQYKDTEICDQLKIVEDSIFEATSQKDVIKIIDETIGLLRSQDPK